MLVHGALHGAWCWDRLVPLLPGPAIAVDLPGRPGNPDPRPLVELRLGDFVDAVVAGAGAAPTERVVLVGHSMAGLSIRAAAAALGGRVESLILVGAVVPADGCAMVDDAPPVVRAFLRARFTRQSALADGAMTLPRWMARSMFCNDMDAADTTLVLGSIVPDAPHVGLEAVPLVPLPGVPTGYVKMARDRAVGPRQADRCIARLACLAPPVVREIDAGHDVMISRPQLLADAIADIRRQAGAGRPGP